MKPQKGGTVTAGRPAINVTGTAKSPEGMTPGLLVTIVCQMDTSV